MKHSTIVFRINLVFEFLPVNHCITVEKNFKGFSNYSCNIRVRNNLATHSAIFIVNLKYRELLLYILSHLTEFLASQKLISKEIQLTNNSFLFRKYKQKFTVSQTRDFTKIHKFYRAFLRLKLISKETEFTDNSFLLQKCTIKIHRFTNQRFHKNSQTLSRVFKPEINFQRNSTLKIYSSFSFQKCFLT